MGAAALPHVTYEDELVRALKEARVEVAGVDRMVLADQLAVMDLIALGRFLLLPEDDLTLATVLKGPLIGLSEEQLYALAEPREDRTLWAELSRRRDEDPSFAAAWTVLSARLLDWRLELEVFLNPLIACVSFLLLAALVRRHFPDLVAASSIPIAWFVFSFYQHLNWIMPWQSAWHFVNLFVIGALVLVTYGRPGWPALWGAATLAAFVSAALLSWMPRAPAWARSTPSMPVP